MSKSFLEKVEFIFEYIYEVNEEPVFQSGISEQEVLEVFQQLGLPPQREIIQLYMTHDGINYLNGFLSMNSIERVVWLYDFYRESRADSEEIRRLNQEDPDFLGDEFYKFMWNENLFPVFDYNGDVSICVSLDTSDLFSFDLADNACWKIAEHYERYLDAIVYTIENSYFFSHKDEGSLGVREEF